MQLVLYIAQEIDNLRDKLAPLSLKAGVGVQQRQVRFWLQQGEMLALPVNIHQRFGDAAQ